MPLAEIPGLGISGNGISDGIGSGTCIINDVVDMAETEDESQTPSFKLPAEVR